MRMMKEKTTWLGGYREQRGTWHGIPYTLRTTNRKGMTKAGRIVIGLAVVLFISILVAKELLI
jgi:hypothetical protein